MADTAARTIIRAQGRRAYASLGARPSGTRHPLVATAMVLPLAALLVVLREVGVSMPASVPESLIAIAIGSIATILVLVRIISIPDDFFFANRGLGIWISLACAIAIILAGQLTFTVGDATRVMHPGESA